MIKCLNIGENQQTFSHHRSGWSFAIQSLQPLHCEHGIKLEGFLDHKIFNKIEINEYFIGFLHNPFYTPEYFSNESHFAKYRRKSIYTFLTSDYWQKTKKLCKGIFVLTENLKNHVMDLTDVECENFIHPTEQIEVKFNFDSYVKNKKIVHLGHWHRRYDSFFKLKSNYEKIIINLEKNMQIPSGIKELKWIENAELDKLLSEAVVFCHFYDLAACNGILDCLIRNTPICINRLPAAEEYLGKSYPLFFENLNHASELLNNDKKIQEAHDYIKKMNKNIFTGDYFCKSIYESKIYQNLSKKKKIKLC
jgi:hypothetical protein